MRHLFSRLLELPFHLILLGVALGFLARWVNPPEVEVIAPRVFPNPIVQPEDDFTELKII